MTAKIVHFVGQLVRGGAEGQLFHLAWVLSRRGWTQAVISFSTGGFWKEPLQQAGIPVFDVRRHLFKPWRLWQCSRLVRQQRPQIILCWSAYKAVYARWLIGAGNVRRVFNLRNDLAVDTNTGKPNRALRWLRGTLQRSDCTVSNSRRNLQVLSAHGVRLRCQEVIYNMVSAPGRARPAEPVPVPRLVAAGALKPLKAYDLLLRALGRLSGEGRPFELLIAGDGPQRQPLEALAGQLGIADRVRFLGEIEDVPGLMATAHLAVHPSRSEGLSNTILEAMGEGLPVVATAVGGTAEIVEDGRTGLLVRPGEVDALTDAVRRLLAEPPLRGRLGAAAVEHIRRVCNEQTIADQYEAVFRRLLAG